MFLLCLNSEKQNPLRDFKENNMKKRQNLQNNPNMFKQITKAINIYFAKTFKACMSAKAAKKLHVIEILVRQFSML